MNDYEFYQSPYSWRYASPEMRTIWSEVRKRRLWRRIWVALAEVQSEFGLVRDDQAADLRAHMDDVDVERALVIEAQIQHDLMAEVKTFAEQCPRGGGIIHLGATSVDVQDNAVALQLRDALDLILAGCRTLLGILSPMIRDHAATPVMAYTHLQPAEPTTLGYRLAQYAQDLLADWENLRRLRKELRGKGFKGAVGASASYAELLEAENLERFEALLSQKLDLSFYPVTTQTYPRKQEYEIVSALAGLGASLHKFAFDLRILQSPAIGELAEPFGREQVGSSAMPFKRNPIRSEKIDSLARMLAQFPRLAWDNAAHSLLERTLDDSANRRAMLPESFLIADELLRIAIDLLKGLRIDQRAISRNLTLYGPFAATEKLLMALGKAGADRQEMHERLRMHTLAAWGAIRNGGPNPLVDRIATDDVFLGYLSAEQLRSSMDASAYVGDAPRRARRFAQLILDGTCDLT
ncbi:MAG: adenylosuccinate lyase [Chloroflexi bacterium]|nr:adenylosuccinate lyase [Chloroflexota bacterium]